ncbi:MAG: arsenate reductase ArsC [Actinobacteria bacterium]|nr:arsenate reductase ArsC [Actinomycetota bacterium]
MKILFLCTGNSCRSQMAEGFLKRYKKGWTVKSAGISPQGLNPWAVKVMIEKNIDISNQKSKGVESFSNETFDYVITVCDNAKESCPIFPGKTKHIHWNLIDPAETEGNIEEKLFVFRQVRDEIQDEILEFIENEDWLNKRSMEI